VDEKLSREMIGGCLLDHEPKVLLFRRLETTNKYVWRRGRVRFTRKCGLKEQIKTTTPRG